MYICGLQAANYSLPSVKFLKLPLDLHILLETVFLQLP